jgi:hypothetical protein
VTSKQASQQPLISANACQRLRNSPGYVCCRSKVLLLLLLLLQRPAEYILANAAVIRSFSG